MAVKVSVVIPVFNAEKYLAECIESLLNQSLKECEFIFVNDGSADQSKTIIEKYKEEDSRIVLINQENQGASAARNNGLKIASGEYVGFVDADDYIERDMYERLLLSAKQGNCDIVISNFESEIDGSKVITKFPFPIDNVLHKDFIEQKVYPYFIMKDNLNTVWNKIYKNKIIIQNLIKFPENIALGEDGTFNMYAFSHATTMKYIDYTGYHYREVQGSATRNILQKDYFKQSLNVYLSALPQDFVHKIDENNINRLKAIKLLNSVLAYIHIYFKPTEGTSFRERFRYVRNMITNEQLRRALIIYINETYLSLGRYERLLVYMVSKRSVLGLYLVTFYSRLRNK
jgi:glycosyltransferase involved in cell wall biosynthesis